MCAFAGAWVITRKRASGSTSVVPATCTSVPARMPCSLASMLVPGPLFHMSYCSFAFGTLMIGARIRIMPSFDAAQACDEFAGTATTAFLVPSMTSMMIEEWQRRC
jgi:hypothetical protein